MQAAGRVSSTLGIGAARRSMGGQQVAVDVELIGCYLAMDMVGGVGLILTDSNYIFIG